MAASGDDGIKKKFFMDLKGLFSQIQKEVDESNQSDTYSAESKAVQLDYDDNGIGNNSNMLHPIRPHSKDCAFFIRTGKCKFGTTCIFNHPVLPENSVDLEKGNGNGVKNRCPIPCKFYLAGICKYGDSCRFNHSISEAEKALGLLNVFGFPKRLGKKNCAFYIRTGMCGYGKSCRFHHPDPLFIVPELYSSVVTGESTYDYKEASEIAPPFSESTLSHLSRPLMTPSASSFVYVHQNFVLGGNKAAKRNQGVRSSFALPAANVETFEDRSYGPPKREPCVLNDVGLPIRPGKKVCGNYERLGLCKFGRTCAYDHPNKHIAKRGSTSEFPSGGKTPDTDKLLDETDSVYDPVEYVAGDVSLFVCLHCCQPKGCKCFVP
ncbi:hypothetical protein OSB04_007685 [Centaurea solstitialis]|uniref:C3H1-type domain-containing protein n=1 Tax=Centaurea solstitialis TaxID=347529 RepID=A0AA38TWZ5_9ASTR|nr:hypothetical protein OSB04_007685 [Centaurea solstitialis]